MKKIIKKVKKHKKKVAFTAIVSLFVMGFAGVNINTGESARLPERKIVVFEDYITNEPFKEIVLAHVGASKVKDLKIVNGAVVSLPDKAVEAKLRKAPGVKRVENDVVVSVLQGKSTGKGNAPSFVQQIKQAIQDMISERRGENPSKAPDKKPEKDKNEKVEDPEDPLEPEQPPQILPWGVSRIGADQVWESGIQGENIKVAIVDTGIEVGHPDLTGNIGGGVSMVRYTASYNDDHGHGTHVAGTVSAISNEAGVIGVSPRSQLYAIKVLDQNGYGYISDIIGGIDWAIANKMNVLNMSLGTTSNIQSFHDAIKKAHANGLIIVAAAGNNGGSVNYPAAYPEVVAVSAIDKNDTITSWSSRGSEIMFSAPGAGILSTYKGKTYAELSGTSMASPHIAGAIAIVKSKNSLLSREQLIETLRLSSVDLGPSGWDAMYGWGVVNIPTAIK